MSAVSGTAHAPLSPPGTGQSYAAYEMRPLHTAAERAEAEALVTDRLAWLGRKYRPYASSAHVPGLFRETAARMPLGMFDDGLLICCLMLGREPDTRCWGSADCGPALLLRHVYALPGQAGTGVARLLTLWATDYAARAGLPSVRVEALLTSGADTPAELVARLTAYLADLGWTSTGRGIGTDGERVARLQSPAEHRPALSDIIRCAVTLPAGAAQDRGSGPPLSSPPVAAAASPTDPTRRNSA
ncbi:hypothetical protein [Streptomyces sp. NPDC005004]